MQIYKYLIRRLAFTDNYIRMEDTQFIMTINYELLRRLYPEWYPESPIHPLLIIFLAIAILLLIPYLYSKYLEGRLTALIKKIRPPRPHMDQILSI